MSRPATEFTTSVDLPHPPDRVFRYLVDPRNRPEWQASLLSVRLHDRGEPRVGTTWRDITMVGFRPHLEITELVPFRVFEETGRWRGVRADLAMRFTSITGGCRITVSGQVHGTGLWSLPARAAGRLAAPAIRVDLVRAGEILTRRPR